MGHHREVFLLQLDILVVSGKQDAVADGGLVVGMGLQHLIIIFERLFGIVLGNEPVGADVVEIERIVRAVFQHLFGNDAEGLEAHGGLDPEKTVRQEIAPEGDTVLFNGTSIGVFGYLKRFLFEDERINTQVKLLSGGERARLALAKILRGSGNFIILDEPANDLDIPTLRVLEDSLSTYTGTLAVVSHDRYFLNRVCTHIIAIEENGNVFADVGDYDSYETRRRSIRSAAKKTAEGKIPKPAAAPKPQTKLSYKEERELESLETEIGNAEAEIASMENMFSEPDFFAKHGPEIRQLQEKLENRKSELNRFYSRWEELEAKKESFRN